MSTINELVTEVLRLDREEPKGWHPHQSISGRWSVRAADDTTVADLRADHTDDGWAEHLAGLIALYRMAAPTLAAEVQRLHAEVSQWIRAAGENEAMYVAQCAELRTMSAALEAARLTLAAERGEQAGAPSERWRWSKRLTAWVLPFLPEQLPEAYRRPWQDTDEDHDPEVEVYRVLSGQWVARWFRGRQCVYYPTAREALLDAQTILTLADRHE